LHRSVENLRPNIDTLLGMQAVKVCNRLGKGVPDRSVYLLSEGRNNLYVERSNGIHARLGRHCLKSSRDNAASFALLLAREEFGYKRHQFTRKALMDKPKFRILKGKRAY